jgi:yecA family protein
MIPPDQDTDTPPLSHEELKVLHHWLRNLNGSGIFQLHGFLSAIITSPTTTLPDEWLPIALIPALSDFGEPREDLPSFIDMVMRFQMEIMESIVLNGCFYPRIDFHAVFPIESCNLLQSQRHHLKEWCQGYLDGMQPTFDDWKPLPDFHNLMYHLSILREDEPTAHSFGFLNTIDINQNQINKLVSDMIESLPILLEIIFEQASELADLPRLIEKNNRANINSLSKHEKAKQLCPCLSGKPFIRCCGLGRGILH